MTDSLEVQGWSREKTAAVGVKLNTSNTINLVVESARSPG